MIYMIPEGCRIKDGYVVTGHGKNTKRYHRQVYYTAYPNTPIDWHVHHIDLNPLNNELDNLVALPPLLHMYIHQVMIDHKCHLNRQSIQEYLDDFVAKYSAVEKAYAEADRLYAIVSKQYNLAEKFIKRVSHKKKPKVKAKPPKTKHKVKTKLRKTHKI